MTLRFKDLGGVLWDFVCCAQLESVCVRVNRSCARVC